jgi:hypothetical protein
MSHHSSHDEDQFRKPLNEAMQKIFGEFPDGKLNHGDEGGIAMMVRVEQGRIIVQFPKPVAWVGMTADEAISLAESLVKRAREAGSKKPLTFTFG